MIEYPLSHNWLMFKRLCLSLLTKSTYHLRWLWDFPQYFYLRYYLVTWSGSLWKKLINIETTTNVCVPNVTYRLNTTFFAIIMTNHFRRIILSIFSIEKYIFLIWFSKTLSFIDWWRVVLTILSNYQFQVLNRNKYDTQLYLIINKRCTFVFQIF